MARLSLTLPAHFPFSTELTVRVTDLNYGNHLGNDRLLGLLHEARWRFLLEHELSERDCAGTTLVLADAAIAYKAEAFAGDRLRVEVALGEPGRVSCDVFYRVTRLGDGALVAEAKTALVCLDPETRRPTAVPTCVLELINARGET
ncbi:MAG: thioesterase family protein [Planctomycetota bacterium]